MNFGQLVQAAQGAAVPGGVTIQTAILPPLTLLRSDGGGDSDDGQAGGPPSPPPLWLRIVRPKVTAATLAGSVVIAPAGDPPDFPVLGLFFAAGALAVLALAVYGGVRMVRG